MTPHILHAALFLWAFYALYVLVMGVYRAKLAGRLEGAPLVLLSPFVVIGAVMDVVCNLTIATVVFVEPPREWLVTKRLQRHHASNDGWRTVLAAYVCDRLLDPFDPTGNHC